MKDEIYAEDVYDLVNALRGRDLEGFRTPDFETVLFEFEIHDADLHGTPFDGGGYELEVSLTGPAVWVHYQDGDNGTETVWKNKSRA